MSLNVSGLVWHYLWGIRCGSALLRPQEKFNKSRLPMYFSQYNHRQWNDRQNPETVEVGCSRLLRTLLGLLTMEK